MFCSDLILITRSVLEPILAVILDLPLYMLFLDVKVGESRMSEDFKHIKVWGIDIPLCIRREIGIPRGRTKTHLESIVPKGEGEGMPY